MTLFLTLLLALPQDPRLAPEATSSWIPEPLQGKHLEVGGRLQSDWTFVAGGEDTETTLATVLEDGAEIRRARLGVAGELAAELAYKFEMDFAGDKNAFTDAFLEYTGAGWGVWKLGHFKEPFSIEELTSSRFITFLERSAASAAFAPARNAGLMVAGDDDAITWAAGVFRQTDDFASTVNEAWSATGRMVYRPYFRDGGRSLAHVGASVSMRDADDAYAAKISPESRLGVSFFSSPSFAADEVLLLGVEAAVQEGPFHGQFEWISADVTDDAGGPEPGMDGFSIQAGWFITGESRGYKTSSGAWDRVKPATPAMGGDGGSGAWEAALRFSSVDMQEAGAADDYQGASIALNWYLTDHARLMLDLIRPELGAADDATVIALRAAFDF